MGFGWFGFGADQSLDQLPAIFPISIAQVDFIRIDVTAIYSRILTDVVERTHGLKEEQIALLWDNCIKSEASEGLITHLARAITDRLDLFLVYEKALGVIRTATSDEQSKIKADYESSNKSNVGVYISFRHFYKSDLVKVYSALEYCSVAALNKAINISKAVQIKMNDLRGSTSLTGSAEVKAQAVEMAKALANGKDIFLDAKDIVETQTPDLTGIQTAMEFITEKRAFYLGMPECYITGEQTGGLGSTGENDSKAIERGLKNYYYSVMAPVFKAIFDLKTTYKSQDFTQITAASDMLKTFSLTDEVLISKENKTLILNRLFDLDEDAEGDDVADTAPLPELVPGAEKVPAPPAKAPKGNQ